LDEDGLHGGSIAASGGGDKGTFYAFAQVAASGKKLSGRILPDSSLDAGQGDFAVQERLSVNFSGDLSLSMAPQRLIWPIPTY
jgi:hypothetical protein